LLISISVATSSTPACFCDFSMRLIAYPTRNASYARTTRTILRSASPPSCALIGLRLGRSILHGAFIDRQTNPPKIRADSGTPGPLFREVAQIRKELRPFSKPPPIAVIKRVEYDHRYDQADHNNQRRCEHQEQ